MIGLQLRIENINIIPNKFKKEGNNRNRRQGAQEQYMKHKRNLNL